MLFECPYHRPNEHFYLQLEPEKPSLSHQTLNKFMDFAQPVVDLLKQLEGFKIPAKVVRETRASLVREGVDEKSLASGGQGRGGRITVKQEGGEEDEEEFRPAVSVEIQDASAKQKAISAEAEAAQQKKRVENIVPLWHQKSTVVPSGSSLAAAIEGDTKKDVGKDGEKKSDVETTSMAAVEEEEEAAILDYYESYYKDLQQNQQQDETGAADVGPDEDEEFLDVSVALDTTMKRSRPSSSPDKQTEETQPEVKRAKVEESDEEFEEV